MIKHNNKKLEKYEDDLSSFIISIGLFLLLYVAYLNPLSDNNIFIAGAMIVTLINIFVTAVCGLLGH